VLLSAAAGRRRARKEFHFGVTGVYAAAAALRAARAARLLL